MKREYFGLLGGSTQPNNKLQKQVWKYFQSLSNKHYEDRDRFFDMIVNKVEKFNAEHKCMPLGVRRDISDDYVNHYVRIKTGDQGSHLLFTLHEVKD